MTGTQNPRPGEGAGAGVSIAADAPAHSTTFTEVKEHVTPARVWLMRWRRAGGGWMFGKGDMPMLLRPLPDDPVNDHADHGELERLSGELTDELRAEVRQTLAIYDGAPLP